jgi:peroxiredoxin
VTQSNNPKEKGALRTDQSQLMSEQGFSFSGYERDPLYLNQDGKKFLDISGVSGIDSITDGRAGVFADFDNDGDLDVFVTTIQGQAHLLFRNNVGQSNNYLRISLEGSSKTGRDAYGAVVRVKTSAGVLTKVKSGGEGFISQHDPRLLFGLGREERAESIEVTWPDGKRERFEGDARAGSNMLLRQGAGRVESIAVEKSKLPDPLTRAEIFARGLKIVVGKAMPDIKLKTLAGATTTLGKQLKRGRRLLINVWATWCVPCASEMPELEKLRPRLEASGIDLIGLNVDTETGAKIKSFLMKNRVRYPIYTGGVEAIEQLYATDELSVPVSLVIDERGAVVEVIPGWSAETERRFAELAGIKGKRQK